MLPPAGVPELATKADLAILNAELAAEVGSLREEMQRALREQTNRFIGWMMGAVGLAVGAAGALSRFG